ncbi:MAG: hypothetical protein SGARI_007350 [Bacillariaceae sp.]
MRDGAVSLPITVSREAFIRDMRYFGFHDAEGSISQDTLDGGRFMKTQPVDLQREKDDIYHVVKKAMEFAESSMRVIDAAQCLYVKADALRYKSFGYGRLFTVDICSEEDKKAVCCATQSFDLFQEQLKKYELKIPGSGPPKYDWTEPAITVQLQRIRST